MARNKRPTSHFAFASLAAAALAAACSSSGHDAVEHGDSGSAHEEGDAQADSGAVQDEAGHALPSSQAVAALAHDALFVVNGGDSTISVINTQTDEVAAVIKLSDAPFPHHLYLSPDGTKLALAIPGVDLSAGHGGGHAGHGGATLGAVLVLDAKTGRTTNARVLDASNHNAAFSPDGREIWTSQVTTPGTVLVLDAASLATLQTIAVGDQPSEITFSTDGRKAFVANGAVGTVTVIDAATKAVLKTVPVGTTPVGAWQGSNGVAYVDNETEKTLSAIDTKTLEVKTTYNLGFMPGMVALAPNGNIWITSADEGKLVVNMADKDMKVSEVATGAGAHGIAFAGDGKTGYVSNQLADTVSVIDVGTGAVRKTLTVGSKPNGMVWRAK